MKTELTIFKLKGKSTSKVAVALAKKLESAIQLKTDPQLIVDVAQAKKKASLIEEEAKGKRRLVKERFKYEKNEKKLVHRAMNRATAIEIRKQQNLESIVAKSIPELKDNAEPQRIDNDWMANFSDRALIFSDELMQRLFAKLLAGEANSPGTFSRRTVDIVSQLEKHEAESFRTLCRYEWFVGNTPIPLIFDYKDEIYERNNLDFEALLDLETIGLIQFSPEISLVYELNKVYEQGIRQVHYQGRALEVDFPQDPNFAIIVGQAKYSKPGSQLTGIFEPNPVEGVYEYVKETWESFLHKP